MDFTTRQQISCCLSLLLMFKVFLLPFPFERHSWGSGISLPTFMQKAMGHHLDLRTARSQGWKLTLH